MDAQILDLPFDPSALNGLSERLLRSHHQNNYSGAVKRLNAIRAQLQDLPFASAPGFHLNGLKREELIATNSMLLHELYFDCLGGGEQAIPAAMGSALQASFGSVERWRDEFVAMGKALGGGSGWVLLTFQPREGSLKPVGCRPHACHRGRSAHLGARHVRTLVPHGFRRCGGPVRRCLHGQHPLGQGLRAVPTSDRSRALECGLRYRTRSREVTFR